MVTYGDLMTQLLIFFVMMFALASAMNELQIVTLRKKMVEYIVREKIEDSVSTDIDERGLIVSFYGENMYEKGESEIKPAALSALKNLTAFVRPQLNQVVIEGHTDMTEESQVYTSHWDLSAARASYIAEILMKSIYFPPYRLSSSGYAEQKPFIKKPSPTFSALEERRKDILKTASSKFLNEVRRMIIREIDTKVLEKRETYKKKYSSASNGKVLVNLAERDYKSKISRKYDKKFNSIRVNKVFREPDGNWSEVLGPAGFTTDELEILAGKENIIKAQYYDKFQKEIVEMANLSPAQQNRNRRVDIIVARISAQARKKRLL